MLLDRGPRATSLVAGLLGLAATFLLALDLLPRPRLRRRRHPRHRASPFAPTLTGKLLATLAGKVDLQEHARAYINRRLLRRATSPRPSTARPPWCGPRSSPSAGSASSSASSSPRAPSPPCASSRCPWTSRARPKLILQAGAVVLALLLPLSLVALGAAVVRAFLSLRPPGPRTPASRRPPARPPPTLGAIPLFARLPPAERQALSSVGEERHFKKSSTLVAQGAQGDRFFAILAGHVSVHVEADSGLSREVARLGPGDCFGEAALLGEGKRTATVKAEEDVTVLSLGKDAFARLAGQLGAAQLSGVIRTSAALKRSSFFGALPAERLSSLAFRLAPRPVTQGEVLIDFGQRGEACYLVSEGKFEVLGEEGKPVATLGPGDHFGEVALLRDVPRTATVRAVEPGVVLSLSREDFLAAVTRDLGLSRRLEALAALRVEASR